MQRKEINPPKKDARTSAEKDAFFKAQQPIGNDGKTNPLFNKLYGKDKNPYQHSERNREFKHLPKRYFDSRTGELKPQHKQAIIKKYNAS